MRNIDILNNFEIEINKIDDNIGKPLTDDSLFWLNQAISRFVKLRFNGDLVHKTGFEQTEKRREDLIKLVTTTTLGLESVEKTNPLYDEYRYEYPPKFMYALSENVTIVDDEGNNKTAAGVFECTWDSFMYRVTNSLTDFHYKYGKARPLRIRTAKGCSLLTDKNYEIDGYKLTYIKQPTKISLDGDEYKTVYPDFDDNVLYEIIKLAAQMYLENVKDERYKTISAEVLTQE